MKFRIVLTSAWLVGCVYGGSNEDPLMGYKPGEVTNQGDPIDAATATMSDSMPATGGSGGKVDAASSVGSSTDGGKVASTTDAGPTGSDAGPTNACMPATPIATCDPVRNTGCPPLTQCDINTTATTPTGQCVFNGSSGGAPAPGTGCTATFVNESCPAQSTCVANECRKLCYCDADCGSGACCNDASGPGPAGAFKLCSPC